MGLRKKYDHAVQTARQLRMDGSVQEKQGRLHITGTVDSEDERNQILNAVKTIPDWQKEVVTDIQIRPAIARTA